MEKINIKVVFLAICTFLGISIISYIVYSPLLPLNIDVVLGKPSSETIEAPQYIEFQTSGDKKKTEKLRNTRRRLIDPIYSIDGSIQKSINEEAISFFNDLRTDKRLEIINNISLFNLEEKKAIDNLSQDQLIGLEVAVLETMDIILKQGVKDVSYQFINLKVKELYKDSLDPIYLSILANICKQFLRPNLFVDDQKTKAVIAQQVSSIKPFMTTYKTGQVIIFKGDLFNEFHLEVLKELKLYGSKASIINFIGIFIFCGLLFVMFERFIYFFYSELHSKISVYLLIYSVLLMVLLLARTMYSVNNLKFIDNLNFLIPLPVVIILLCLLLSPNIALISGIICSVLISIMYQNDILIFLYLFFSTCATVFSCYRIYRRSDLVKAGNVIGIINVIVIFSIGSLSDISSIIWYLYNGIIGFSNGLLCAMLSLAFLPYFEAVFKITTSLGLLESSNLNHPLLKKLMLNAPGTYQHSLMVANLSEAAAEAIGADLVLSRIGAYFHDIGKMKRPIFFSENQLSTGNPHENLSPRMSKMIIAAHTKDGVEMAQKYKLPKILQDIMVEHHGTSLVSFFYSIAKQQEMIDSDDEATKEDFRYSGPKPQTKESGIIMLADSTEASIRSMDKPTLPKIENLIEKVFLLKITDNQMDESGLSLNDVQKIKTTFLSIFRSIYHSRLDYEEEMTKIIDQTKRKHNEN